MIDPLRGRSPIGAGLFFVLSTLGTPAPAQVQPEGYSLDSVSHLPASTQGRWQLAGVDGALLFDGTDLSLKDSSGTTVLLTFASPVFSSFAIEVGNGRVLFGENSGGELWLVPLSGGTPSLLATVTGNYSAALLDAGTVLLSAKTGGFSAPDNHLLTLDLAGGSTRRIGTVPGASGPVVLDDAGNLLYATATMQFPAPPGTTDLLSWTPAQIAAARNGATALTPATAAVRVAGLDSAGTLALDRDGDVFFTDWFNSRIAEIDDVRSPGPTVKTWMDYTGTTFSPGNVQFLPDPRAPASLPEFEPFQPDLGHELHVFETDYTATMRARRITTERATLTPAPSAPVPAGAFDLVLVDAAAGGTALMALGVPASGTGEQPFKVPGIEQTVLWMQALTTTSLNHVLSLDAGGGARLPLTNPGLPGLTIDAQAAFLDAAGTVLGTSAPVTFTLQ